MTAHNNLHTVLYNAPSAEYIALCRQIYKLARHTLAERLREKTYRNPAVVLDLDETVLNNVAYQAWLIRAGVNFHESTNWKAWCDAGEAEAVPGAVEFVRFAQEAGVTPIFVTSRQNVTRTGTAANLRMLALLSADEYEREQAYDQSAEHAYTTRLFMKGMPAVEVPGPSGRTAYALANKYLQRIFCEQVRELEIIMSIGDNLSDYAEYYGNVFDETGSVVKGKHPNPASRRQSALQDVQLFGRDFILLPNPSYGGWLRAFEANGLGASDELAYTSDAVREGLAEPQEEFELADGQKVKAKGPKFAPESVRIWSGPAKGE